MISSLELARLCGVSQGTVDRALHDRSGISTATRDRILTVARQHGYLPNPTARELMGRAASPMVGVVLPESGVQGTFFMDLIAAIGQRLRTDNLRLNLWPCLSEEYASVAADVAARRQRALVLMLPPEDLSLDPAISRAVPVVSLLLSNRSPGVISLIPDERDYGRVATQHLLDLGHRRIAHLLGPIDHHVSHDRAEGYRAAMIAAGAEPQVMANTVDDAVVARLRTAGITAVFCHHDPQAMALIRCAHRAGLAVPGDLSVIGVDLSPTAAALDATLTTVPYPYVGIAEQLAAVLAGRPLPPLPAPTVVVGRTSGPPRRG